MRSVIALWLLPALSWAAVDGTVRNGTTETPQAGALVTLYRLGERGMQPVKSLKSDEAGRFRFEQDLTGPHLLQVIYAGVIYNQMLSPGAASTGIVLDVFNSSAKPGEAKVAQHMVLFEPAGDELRVSENVLFENKGQVSYSNPSNGTLRVFLPEAAQGKARVMVTAPGGMPVERSAEKTARAGEYKIDFPIKPGETRFDITYVVPFASPGTFRGKVLHDGAMARLVTPAGVSLSGKGVKLLGQEPATQASIYEIAQRDYSVEIEGTGALRSETGSDDEDAGPSIEQILPRMYDNVYAILGLSLAILLVGFLLLYRRGAATPAKPGPPSPPQRGGRRR
jgi:hypothetical protein